MPETATLTTKEWLDVPECADEIDAGTRTIRTAIKRGELRASAINARGDLRIHRDWLAEWMLRSRVGA